MARAELVTVAKHGRAVVSNGLRRLPKPVTAGEVDRLQIQFMPAGVAAKPLPPAELGHALPLDLLVNRQHASLEKPLLEHIQQ